MVKYLGTVESWNPIASKKDGKLCEFKMLTKGFGLSANKNIDI